MKKNMLLTFAIVIGSIFVFSSCTKEDEVDIRDSYIGTYQGAEVWVKSGLTYRANITLKVTKSETSTNKIIIESTFFNPTAEIVSAEVKNGDFSTAFTSVISGISKTVTITNGNIDGQKINYSYTAPDFVTVTLNADKL